MIASRNRLAALLVLSALAGAASAATLVFPDLTLTAGTDGTPYSTSTTSTLGTLAQNATLSFTLTTDGSTYLSDLRVALSDPSGTTTTAALPGAPDAPGDYSGAVTFASVAPTSGVYSIAFTNTYDTAFDVTLSDIKLTVTQVVPEPASLSALGLGALAFVRRRRAR